MEIKPYPPAKPSDIDKVVQLLETIRPLSEALRQEIHTHMVALKVKKGGILIREGDTCQYMYYIVKGALMAHATHNGRKITTYISVEQEFVSSISGMHGRGPTKEGIVAVEPTELIAIPNNILLGFFEKYFEFNYAFRELVQLYYQHAQERSHIIRVGNAKERYHYFIQTKPGYIDRLPLEHIASLLNMKPATLARIRKQHALLEKKDKETEQLCRRLEYQLVHRKLYTKKDISLSAVARAVGITTHRLSALLNNQYQQPFTDLINTYRVKLIQEQMSVPDKLQHFTIEAIAYNAGFASRSAFYKAFRKLTGLPPTEYAQRIFQP